jgi:hypothetical protein
LRQPNRCCGAMSCRRPTPDTTAPGAYDSATIRPLVATLQRRRRPTHPDTDIDSTPRLRRVIYMVDHMCEPICQSRFASCGSNRALQGGSRVPLTIASPSLRQPPFAPGWLSVAFAYPIAPFA